MIFTLKINLGNDAMQTREDVAEALEQVKRNIVKPLYAVENADVVIRDRNGTQVGTCRFSEDEE